MNSQDCFNSFNVFDLKTHKFSQQNDQYIRYWPSIYTLTTYTFLIISGSGLLLQAIFRYLVDLGSSEGILVQLTYSALLHFPNTYLINLLLTEYASVIRFSGQRNQCFIFTPPPSTILLYIFTESFISLIQDSHTLFHIISVFLK